MSKVNYTEEDIFKMFDWYADEIGYKSSDELSQTDKKKAIMQYANCGKTTASNYMRKFGVSDQKYTRNDFKDVESVRPVNPNTFVNLSKEDIESVFKSYSDMDYGHTVNTFSRIEQINALKSTYGISFEQADMYIDVYRLDCSFKDAYLAFLLWKNSKGISKLTLDDKVDALVNYLGCNKARAIYYISNMWLYDDDYLNKMINI